MDFSDLTPQGRDDVIRTILGEAGAESPEGVAAVIWTMLNRAKSDRFPNNLADVATQGRGGRFAQFSTWNTPSDGGNRIPDTARPSDPGYRRASAILNQVLSGEVPDPTGGAIHYYSPAGMPGGREPSWWGSERERQGGDVTRIGTHRFISPDGTSSTDGGIMSTIQSRAGMLRDAFSPTPEGEEPVSLADRIDMGLGALFGTTDEGPSREGPDPERVARLRGALESGEISQEMYEDYYARLALEGPESSGRAAGLSNLSSYLLNSYEPQRFVGTSLPTSPMRGNSGSGTSAIQRLGVKPLA